MANSMKKKPNLKFLILFSIGTLVGIGFIITSLVCGFIPNPDNLGWLIADTLIGVAITSVCGLFTWMTYMFIMKDVPYSKKAEARKNKALAKYHYRLTKKVQRVQTSRYNKELRKKLGQEYKANKK